MSQVNQYERCPYSYYLSRIEKVWQRPAAWLAQGTAVHEAAEAWERSGRSMTLAEAQDVFRDSYQRTINEACESTPNFETWFKSGPYGGELDIERRYGIGLEQTERYVSWYESHPDELIWVAPDGTPGIEIGFDIDLDGVLVRGYIDAVIEKNGDVVVRDNKTGNSPGDDFQLGVYAVALSESYGIEAPLVGDYWMGRSGKPTVPYKLDYWTRERVTETFHELDQNVRAGNFPPKPSSDKCRFCDVSWACEYAVG